MIRPASTPLYVGELAISGRQRECRIPHEAFLAAEHFALQLDGFPLADIERNAIRFGDGALNLVFPLRRIRPFAQHIRDGTNRGSGGRWLPASRYATRQFPPRHLS